jgi:4-phytase/acid phosphatase
MVVCLAVASSCSSPAQSPTGAAQEHLKFALVLSRHGVRSPTWTNARLDEYAAQPWPKWPVAPGLLTPHGKQLMMLFGGYYRASFAAEGLLSASGCSDANRIYIDADIDERTVETGRGLADGLAPGCNVAVHSFGADMQDDIFHSLGKVGAGDPKLAFAAVAGRIGGAPEALLPAYQAPLEAMHELLDTCAGIACASSARKDLLQIPSSLKPGAGDHLVDLKGPLTTAATFAEDLQLEYLEGMPADQVGWGRADEAKVRAMMALHAASSDLVQRTPYIAAAQASNLLLHIVHTLEQAERGQAVAGAIGKPSNQLTILVGHDTNISNVAALLDAHWLVNGYQRDDAAPGGALVFELWQRSGHPDAVRVYYTVQTPEQMRRALPLSLAAPPEKAVIFLPGCSKAEAGSPCNWEDFERLTDASVNLAHVH